MAQFRVGGDPESYMEAPILTGGGGGGKGGPSIFATILDALGIHKQVAKAPKDDPAAPATTQEIPPPPEMMPVINEVESAFKPMMPMASDWGQKYLESSKPLKKVDPNQDK